MSLDDAAHKAARNGILNALGLGSICDQMIRSAEQSYAAGKKATPYMRIQLPNKWRRMSGGVGDDELAGMVKEVLAEDGRLEEPFVYFLPYSGLIRWNWVSDHLILKANELPTGKSTKR